MSKEAKEKLLNLLKSFSTAILVTQGENEPFHARPMALVKIEEDNTFWFFTDWYSEKIAEIQQGIDVCVICQKDRETSVIVYGIAQPLRDKSKNRELWSEPFRVWFPDGPESASLALIRVQPTTAEYWDNTGINKIRYAFESAKAYLSGTRPRIEQGDQHGKVEL